MIKNIKKNYSYLLKCKAIKLKNIILKKRYYVDNVNLEKFDLLFDNYKYSIIRRMLHTSEAKRLLVNKYLTKKKFRNRIFIRSAIKGIAERIKNELLIMSPELLVLHIQAKS